MQMVCCALMLSACDSSTDEAEKTEAPALSLWEVPAEAEQDVNPVRYDVDSVHAGKQLFEQHCQQCHGYYGEGNGMVGAMLDQRPANLLRLAGKQAEGAFAWKIREGRGDMPAYEELLSDTAIWQIVNFVASLENEEGTQP
jgi:mono/diheme cytochrome c family protein